jgi:PAS domain S-box-containing protein
LDTFFFENIINELVMENKTMNFLVIDSNKSNIVLLKSLLTNQFPHAKCFFTESGEKGIEQAKAKLLDVIFLDIKMAIMDTSKVFAKLKNNDLFQHTPIIILTDAETKNESRKKALEIGANAFLSHPIDESELTAQVKSMLQIKRLEELLRGEKNRLNKLGQQRTQELEEELKKVKETEAQLRIEFTKSENSRESTSKMILDLKKEMEEGKQKEKTIQHDETTVSNKLKAITESNGDIDSLELSEIIDTDILQSILNDFYELTGMLGAILDTSGKVLVAVGWQDVCTKFHRCHPDTLKNCIESDTILTQGVAEGTYKGYRCKNNMWDIVTPLVVGGKHVGNVFMGQYFDEDEIPDKELFRQQAQKYGFEETEYLAALDKVPRFSKETINKGMHFYSELAKIISTMSYSTIQQSRMLAERKLTEIELLKSKEAAEKSEKYLDNIINGIGDPVFVKDDKSRLLLVNDAFCKIFNLSRDKLIGRTLAKEVPQEERESFLRIDKQVLSDGKENITEEFLTVRNEKAKTISTRKTRFIDNEGKKYLIGVIRDISERKLSEEKITSQLKELRSWHSAMLGREERILDIKREVNNLLIEAGKPIRYTSLDPNALDNLD